MADTVRAKQDDDTELAETDPLFQLTQIMGVQPPADEGGALDAMAAELDRELEAEQAADVASADSDSDVQADTVEDISDRLQEDLADVFDNLDLDAGEDEVGADGEVSAGSVDETDIETGHANVPDAGREAGEDDPLEGVFGDGGADDGDSDDRDDVSAEAADDDTDTVDIQQKLNDLVASARIDAETDMSAPADEDGGADEAIDGIDFENDEGFEAAFAEIDDDFDTVSDLSQTASEESFSDALDEIFAEPENTDRTAAPTDVDEPINALQADDNDEHGEDEPEVIARSEDTDVTANEDDSEEKIEDRIASIFGRATPIAAGAAIASSGKAEEPDVSHADETDGEESQVPEAQPEESSPEFQTAEASEDDGFSAEDEVDDEPTAAFSEADSAAPDINTIAIEDEIAPAMDDLDIPEVSLEQETAKSEILDDLDADLTRDFVEPQTEVTEEAAAGAKSADSGVDRELEDDFATLFDDTEELLALESSVNEIRSAARSYGRDDADLDANGDEPEPELAGMGRSNVDWTSSPGEPGKPAGRRGMMVAAMIGGIALLGGVAAFALSYGGGEPASDPIVIKADTDPVKIKPKDPGGTTVPNQDKKVYEQVAGDTEPADPAQKKLVTTSEEPVDIATRAPAKSEERLAPGIEVTRKLPETNDPVALAPRRVRTMVVKPDGTLVPRPDPVAKPVEKPTVATATESAPAAAETETAVSGGEKGMAKAVGEAPKAAKEPAEPAAVAVEKATGKQTGAEEKPTEMAKAAPEAKPVVKQAVAPEPKPAAAAPEPVKPVETATQKPREVVASAAEDTAKQNNTPLVEPVKVQSQTIRRQESGGIRTTPAAVPAVPSRPADQPVNVIGSTRDATPSPERETASQVQVASAPASQYSVQIASQPSREAAQSSYVTLARRYGSILGGRGMNIVEAEIAGRGTYYRVRIPASSRSDALELCARYKAAGGDCYVP